MNAAAQDLPLPTVQRYRLEFTGDGGEYFRIWVVNLLLTIVTIGIYSAWAKVRKNHYFYNNTRLDGSVFEYHGKPAAILKGRAIVLALVAANQVFGKMSLAIAVTVAVVAVAVLPWLVVQSMRFRLRNSSYRGLRFGFHGTIAAAYRWMAPPLAAILVIGVLGEALKTASISPAAGGRWIGLIYLALFLAWPYLHWRMKQFQHAGSDFGQARGRFRGRIGRFYLVYLQGLGLALGCFAVVGVVAFVLFRQLGPAYVHGAGPFNALALVSVAAGIAIYAALIGVAPFVSARLQNHVWNHTLLGRIGFESRLPSRRLVFVVLGNFFLILLTLGLYTPFAAVRSWRTRIEAVGVLSTSDLTGFVAVQGDEVAATGEGAADLLGVDFAL